MPRGLGAVKARRSTRAYWVTSSGVGELRSEVVADFPRDGRSLLRAEFSGVSPGTERLVGLGHVPSTCGASMACRYMAGSFDLPIKYGYDLVATGVAGALEGRRVFTMHPHQELCEVEDADATVLPDGLPAKRAALIPNLETALNAVWDAELNDDEQALVVGGGSVGLLVAYVLSRRNARRVPVVEVDESRASLAARLPWVERVLSPRAAPRGAVDVAFHTSGSGAGLQLAIDAIGFEGRVIELSWYGEKPVTLELGSSFHGQRKRIQASQVGTIAPSMRSTHDFAGRLAEVLRLLDDPALDQLLSAPVPFEEMPALMAELYAGRSPALLPLIAY